MTSPTHIAAPMPASDARTLFDARRTDMLNAWRQLVRSIGQTEAAAEAKATARAMRQVAAEWGRG